MNSTTFYQQTTAHTSKILHAKVQAHLLSPVHIGSGHKLFEGVDYIKSGNHTFLLNIDRLIKAFGADERFMDSIKKGRVGDFLDQQGVSPEKFSYIMIKGATRNREINDLLRNGFGLPTLPGSSIKGSIRSVLYADRLKKLQRSILQRLGNKPKARNTDSLIQKDIMAPGADTAGKAPNHDIGRYVRIGDAHFSTRDIQICGNAILAYDKKSDREEPWWIDLSKRNPQERYTEEAVESATVIAIRDKAKSEEFGISLDTHLFKDALFKEKLGLPGNLPDNWVAFAELMNKHAESLLVEEMKTIRDLFGIDKERTDDIDSIIEEIEQMDEKVAQYYDHLDFLFNEGIPLKEDFEEDGISWVQRVGWGSGWTAMTGGSISSGEAIKIDQKMRQNKNNRGKGFMKHEKPHRFPKTRKVVPKGNSGVTSMGWVKIQITEAK